MLWILISLSFYSLSLPPIITSTSTVQCNQKCGQTAVPYPFGFSIGCPIPLSCSIGNAIRVGEFSVRNLTSESIIIDLPPSCNRPISSLSDLFRRNYAVTSSNSLLLRRCRSPVSSCLASTSVLSGGCDDRFKFDNISCFTSPTSLASGEGGLSFANHTALASLDCKFLFGSFEYGSEEQLPSIVFRKLELGWWLEGECRCDNRANCTILWSPVTGKYGFRCRCREGFQGDGFLDGVGCRPVRHPSCNPSKYMSGNCGGAARLGVLIGGIGAGASIMACVALAYCFICHRRSSSSGTRKSTKRLPSQTSLAVPLYPYKDIERATNGFSDSLLLGVGAYGKVYAGKLNNDKLVAIKKIKHRDTNSTEQVLNEITLLSSVSHPNLVRLLGCCIEREEEQILLYEFMANGTLSQHLQRERGPPLPWTVRLAIATETAEAIAYLHSAVNPPIYHRDIKSSNILLDFNYNSKVADFGLSRTGMTETSHISTAPQGTPGYLDPQYHQNFHLSDKSDVYSFGVVLVEIITAQKVVDFSRVQNEVNLAALAIDKIGKGRVDEIIDPFLGPNRDPRTNSSIHKVAELAFRCLAFHRDMRPSMTEVAEELEQIRLSGWVPSQASSICSSPLIGSERSHRTSKGRTLIITDRFGAEEMVKSPVSVHDEWLSEQSSPSTNSLLKNVAQ